MAPKVLIPVDDSPQSRIAVDLTYCYSCLPTGAEIHLASVLHPITVAYPVTPMVPMASSAAVASVQQNQAQQQAVEKEKAQETLTLAKELLMLDYKVPEASIHTHMLPATGGASGVSESIVKCANENKMDLVIVGSRGMGAFKRSMMSLVGLGSVSDAVMRNCHCPIILIRNQAERMSHPVGAQGVPKRICVAYDESPQAQQALRWALDNMWSPQDELHLASVAIPTPYPVLDEPATAAAVEANMAKGEVESAKAYAARILQDAAQAAVLHGVPQSQIKAVTLMTSGGSSEAGSSLEKYTKEASINLMVVGNRGMGAVKRSLMGFIGLGSVSEHLAHHLECLLAIVKVEHAEKPAVFGHGKEAFILWHG